MRIHQWRLPEVDNEGFPVSTSSSPVAVVRTTTGLDEESGELVHVPVLVVRPSPAPSPPSQTSQPLLTSPPYLQLTCNQCLSSIPFSLGPFSLPDLPDVLRSLDTNSLFYNPNFRIDVNSSVPVIDIPRSRKRLPSCPLSLRQKSGFLVDSQFSPESEFCNDCHPPPRPRFQIPLGSLENSSSCSSNIIHISAWQEFIYSPCVILRLINSQNITVEDLPGMTSTSSHLSSFLDKSIADAVLYIFFFSVYFISCILFNDYIELMFYILYGGHLSLHLLTSYNNANIIFTGRSFQGPAYVLIRTFCQHCQQTQNAKVMRRLMKKMKQDIVNSKMR